MLYARSNTETNKLCHGCLSCNRTRNNTTCTLNRHSTHGSIKGFRLTSREVEIEYDRKTSDAFGKKGEGP